MARLTPLGVLEAACVVRAEMEYVQQATPSAAARVRGRWGVGSQKAPDDLFNRTV